MPVLPDALHPQEGSARAVLLARALEKRDSAGLPTAGIAALAALFGVIVLLGGIFLAYRLGAPGFTRVREIRRTRHVEKTRAARHDVLGADLDSKPDRSPTSSTRSPSPSNPLLPRPFPPPEAFSPPTRSTEIALVYAPPRSDDGLDLAIAGGISQFQLRDAPRAPRRPAPVLAKEKERPLPTPKTSLSSAAMSYPT